LTGAHCLVTGSAGFVGKHLVTQLLEAGSAVVALSRRPEGARSPGLVGRLRPQPGLTRATADLRDPAATRRMVCDARPTHVFHLAGVRESAPTTWAALHEGNVLTTLHLLEALRAEELRPWMLIAGSSAVYGAGADIALTEDAPVRPHTLYGVAKAAQELLAVCEEAAYQAQVVRARMFNLLGPGQGPSMLIPGVAHQIALAEHDPDGIVQVGNLDAERDYLDVRDAAAALVLLGRAAAPSGPYNVASGVARSSRECVRQLLALARRPIALQQEEARRRAVDVARQVGDSSRLRGAVGWNPEIAFDTSLSDVLEDWRRRVGDPAAV